MIRECHGDLHLGNVALVGGEPIIFDCIEFDPAMRWIDVVSDVAFAVMDLQAGGRADLAARLLNAYLEITGDYAGVAVLRFYVAYRAMVRAKIALLRAAQQPPGTERSASVATFRLQLELTLLYTRPAPAALIIMHGFAGSGKSTLAQRLVEEMGGIRIRTDVERKRLHGTASRRISAGGDSALYTPDATRATYARVMDLARHVVAAGHVAIVDATFLRRWQRDLFRGLAAHAGVPFVIVDLVAPEHLLRERIVHRSRQGSDVSDADTCVLAEQMRSHEPLADDERSAVMTLTVNEESADCAEGAPASDWSRLVAGVRDAIATTNDV
jgi:predicted kinase